MNQAFSLHESGEISKAKDICYRIIEADKRSFNGHHLLAVIEAKQANYGKAIKHFQEALKYGESSDIYYNLAWISNLCNQHEKVLEYASKLIEILPNDPRGHRMLARYYKREHKIALKHAEKALELDPNDKTSQLLLYKTLINNGHFLEVIKNLQDKLSSQNLKDKELLFFLARQYIQADIYAPELSEELFNKANKILTSLSLDKNKQDASKAESLLAQLAERQNSPVEIVEQHLNRAMQLFPSDHYNALALSFSLLKQKKWHEGFKLYDARRYLPGMQLMLNQYSHVPLINLSKDLKGSAPLTDMNIVALSEQGIGDTIQFIRFAPLLKRLGAKSVAIHVPPPLKKLARSLKGADKIVSEGDNLNNVNAIVPMMSIPAVLNISQSDFSDPELIQSRGYLNPQPKDKENSLSLPCIPEYPFKIGIVWQGNKSYDNDNQRSIPFEKLKPLFNTSFSSFFSLQVPSSDDFIKLSQNYENLVDMSPYLNDFNDTAIVMKQLDLLISVDTSTLHLAGALGVKAWALIPSISDWRWHENKDDKSCWYDSISIFRAKNGWSRLIEETSQNIKNTIEELDIVSESISNINTDQSKLHSEILTLINAEEWDKAYSKAEAFSMLDKKQAHAHNYLGTILAQKQKINKAIIAFEKGLSTYKNSSPSSLSKEQIRVFTMLTINLCSLLASEKQTEKAWEYTKNAISRDFIDNNILHLAVNMFHSHPWLIPLLKEKRRKFRDNLSIKQSIAACLIKQNSLEEATSILTAINHEIRKNSLSLSLPWQQDVLWSQIAVAFLNQNNEIEAQKSFQKAYSINPDKPSNIINHTATLALVGESQQAINVYKKHLSLSTNTQPDIIAEFCAMLINNDRKNDAINYALDAIKKFPEHHKLQKIVSFLQK